MEGVLAYLGAVHIGTCIVGLEGQFRHVPGLTFVNGKFPNTASNNYYNN